ncbi:MAG: hypothetical protein A2054_09290 [Deltaproteobacteria bacterium GWA2_55_10]|nr:MAG: hypothetical protein A2054_09290 [Deltaproteobacteria bacterium GWA2_55_10]
MPSVEEFNISGHIRTLWKWKFLTIALVAVSTFSTAFYSLFIDDLYESSAVITPISGKDAAQGGLSVLSSQLAGISGISLPGGSSASEIYNLLKSNVLREKVIRDYDLLPVLFSERWDPERKEWKKPGPEPMSAVLRQGILSVNPGLKKKSPAEPGVWDGIRALDKAVKVGRNVKDGTVTVSAEFKDPEIAAGLIEYHLRALTDHMSNEAQRVAKTNRKYLEGQLNTTADPFIRQKLYSMIAQQMEVAMLSEVKENFAFKVVDPPRAPDRKSKPDRGRMVRMSFSASLLSGLFLSFFLERVRKGQ